MRANSYTAKVPHEDEHGAWIVDVTVYPARSGEGAQFECVTRDGDPDREPDAAALERILADEAVAERLELAAIDIAADAEEAAQEDAWEARADWAREECR